MHSKDEFYLNLTPWQKVQIARHLKRPHTSDIIGAIVQEFVELHGDRAFCDDAAIISGLGRIEKQPVAIVGHEKGHTTEERIRRNFGMANPEGYRKARRIFKIAEKFSLPVVTFIDTSGAYPGIGAEERGQAEAIAVNLRDMAGLRTPIISVVLGEGGSGGALGIGVADRVLMLEHAIYSVISPEGCASILWRDAGRAENAADALKLTAQNLMEFGMIDEIIAEPVGGAHNDPLATANSIKQSVIKHISQLKKMTVERLVSQRYQRLRKIGAYQ